MRLKKIEIKGFKSFADKTTILFNDNITGIVGPNGCGKSNVVDAIRWVLGEQKTSQLRLEKMDNVLFNGCKTRKATNLAEVSLTFDNTKNILSTDFQEVAITRKLFRSGESEYRINNITCRLKDIQNLFQDSGIGSDSYAIIELGMVDDILQNKNQSRRALFEQAAGISKYKIRKKESLQKLKSTEENILRIDDLLSEIESNLKTLETQAKRAERYQKIREEYKEITLDMLKIQVANYKESYNRVYQKKQEETEALDNITNQLTIKENKLQADKLTLLEMEKQLHLIQKKFNDLAQGLNTSENERNILKEQIKSFDALNQKIAEQQAQYTAELATATPEITILETEAQKTALEKAKIEAQYAENKNSMELLDRQFQENKTLLDRDKTQFQTLQNERIKSEKQLDLTQHKLQTAENILAVAGDQKNKISAQIATQTAESEAQKSKIAELDTQITALETVEQIRNQKMEDLQKKNQDKKSEIQNLQRKYDGKRNEYSLLKSMIDNLEGFPDSIKHLKKNVPQFAQIPVVSDLIQCADEYKPALELLIAPYANYFVVQTAHEAELAIDSLYQSQSGKTGFFILEWIEKLPKPKIEILAAYQSVLEVVQIDAKYGSLAQWLFAHCYLVRSGALADLAEHEGKKNPKATFVDMDNLNIINAESIFGGARSLFDGAQIGRSKNLDKLKDDYTALENQIATAEKELKKSSEDWANLHQQSAANELQTMRNQKNAHEKEFSKAQILLDQYQLQFKNFDQQTAEATQTQTELKEEQTAIQATLKTLQGEIEAFQTKNSAQQSEFELFVQKMNGVRQQLQTLEVERKSLENAEKSTAEKIAFYTQKTTQLSDQILKCTEQIAQNQADEKRKIAQLMALEENIFTHYSDRDQSQKNIETAEKEYYTMRGAVIEFENEIATLRTQKNSLQQIQAQYDQKIAEMRLELQSVKEQLRIEFQLELEVLLNGDLTVEGKLEDLQTRQNHYRKRLETFGEINPMAIESYKEIKERYDFLAEQRRDILESKQNLLATLKEIDETAKAKFLASFHAIRDNFIRTFRVLFTQDDDCDLVLTEPNNPTESDIEIIAKPKGKKPLTINQLSGGEKTLTATALLFSLYLLKPAPFCIFDEVDAPLDDSNIAKFNRIIEEFSKNSQFIIVTHNKTTMASVEILYGVTMQEQGVSKIVPVDFRKLAVAN